MYTGKSYALVIGCIAALNLFLAFQARDDTGKAVAFALLAAGFTVAAFWIWRRSSR